MSGKVKEAVLRPANTIARVFEDLLAEDLRRRAHVQV